MLSTRLKKKKKKKNLVPSQEDVSGNKEGKDQNWRG